MSKKLTVIPEQCSGCKICELVCSIKHFGVNNPKKAAIRVMVTYPHPVMRMPIVCGSAKCQPVNRCVRLERYMSIRIAISQSSGYVWRNPEVC